MEGVKANKSMALHHKKLKGQWRSSGKNINNYKPTE